MKTINYFVTNYSLFNIPVAFAIAPIITGGIAINIQPNAAT